MEPRETYPSQPNTIKEKKEVINNIETVPPAVESFFDITHATKVWPEEIITNKTFLKQIEKRKDLIQSINDVFNCLPRPDMSLKTAISQKHITEEQITKLYVTLSDLLESDPDYKRIILYIPFELLPNKKWLPFEGKTQQASYRFNEAYLRAWKELFLVQDVRANFVDGDVLEVEKRDGDLPRVVKAAHLIPKLVESGLLDFAYVLDLLKESTNQTLRNSIADTLPVLADLGFITEKEIALMKKSNDRLIVNMAHIIVSNIETNKKQTKTTTKSIDLPSVQEALYEKFSQVETEEYDDITEKRKEWLKQKKKQKTIALLGADIGTAIIEKRLTDETLNSFLTHGANSSSQQALIEGIREAIESIESIDHDRARELYEKYKETLLTLWESNNSEIRESLSKNFRRLHYLNIVDDRKLAELNIAIPTLTGPFSENLKAMTKEMSDIQNIAVTIESVPGLAKLLYPVVLVYGSCLKGYSAQTADIDLGVFVKPGISLDDRVKLQELLQKTFTHERIKDKIVEFWLEEKDGWLNVRDFESPDVSLGESHWTHILFGAAWKGNRNVIKELHKKLLVPYMNDADQEIQEHNARSLYLEEMERDALQYRLMHKGYEKFFPPYGGVHTPHADEIDGDSTFWDSGYRQLATRLFVSRVFLPKIKQ